MIAIISTSLSVPIRGINRLRLVRYRQLEHRGGQTSRIIAYSTGTLAAPSKTSTADVWRGSRLYIDAGAPRSRLPAARQGLPQKAKKAIWDARLMRSP